MSNEYSYQMDAARIMISPTVNEIREILKKAPVELITKEMSDRNVWDDYSNGLYGTNSLVEALWSIKERTSEVMAFLFIDNNQRRIGYKEITQFDPKQVRFTAREAVKYAIENGACAVAMAHNHPHSNSCDPSNADIEITCAVAQALNAVGITVIDHLIFSKTGILSFGDSGAMEIINSTICENTATRIIMSLIGETSNQSE